ncbi:hypothetical protein EBAPG3_001420 [Nitrosospira lacus]|uniref:PEP-CTERM sorting domain-containing protein n=1 Tax=Nitrosospira lacus TaxID=1288494 RepID=A0A1W6SL74_9PROT|nr:polysaccharide lyase [Nitrosospira lacus]ARO86549.1 hypothetical protein EBAPG3_001420 [Nitrosospira lacus]
MTKIKVVVANLALVFFCDHASADIVFDGRFSEGDFSRYAAVEANGTAINATLAPHGIAGHLERVLDPAGSGGSVMRATRLFGDSSTSGGFRSEVSASKDPMGSERWYSWGYYLPDSLRSVKNELVIAQIQSLADTGESSLRYPTLALVVQDDKIKLSNSFDYDRITSPLGTSPKAGIDFERRELASWTLDTEKWTFLDLHVKWAADNTGFLEFWKDGVLLFQEENHINTFNDEHGLWFKTGTYVFPTLSTWPSVTTYSSGVKIGDGKETFQSMAISVVPEPNIYVMMMTGLLGVGFRVYSRVGRQNKLSI